MRENGNCARNSHGNPFHLHIYTRNEMDALLDELSAEHVIADNRMFFARKAR